MMADLQSLPREVLDMIAEEVARSTDTSPSYEGLKNLSLTSQQLRVSAQNVMFCNVIIQRPELKALKYYDFDSDYGYDYDFDHEVEKLSSLGCLVRTIIQRPDLASLVRTLDVSITRRTIENRNITELCVQFLKTASIFIGPSFNDAQWVSLIHIGEQLALMGIILACTSKLRTLRLSSWYCSREVDDNTKYEWVPEGLDWQRLFGNLALAPGFSMSWISGLANLRSLSANCLIPSKLITIPGLESVEFGMQNRQFSRIPDSIGLPSQPHAAFATSVLKKIKIIFDVDCVAGGFSYEMTNYIKTLGQQFPALSNLDLVIRPIRRGADWHMDELFYWANLNKLMRRVCLLNIKTLKIDTSALTFQEIDTSSLNHWEGVRGKMRWADMLYPILDLTRFTQLRKVVAAQEAFFSVSNQFFVCKLPTSIEEIGILDTTCAVDFWLKYLFLWMPLPNLKRITFCTKEKDDDPYGEDVRLGNVNDYPWEDADSVLRGITPQNPKPVWKKQFFNATIRMEEWWKGLRANGVKLNVNHRTKGKSEVLEWTEL